MHKLVVLTGAGISAESGLKTFRDAGGLWEGYDINEVASIEGWLKDKEKVLNFYNLRREQALTAKPNAAHKAIANIQDHFDVHVVTQNIDNLHEKAGSEKVTHLHGEISKVRSEEDESLILEWGNKPLNIGDKGPDGAQLRPHVVWFGEMVPMLEAAAEIVEKADLLMVVGTSLAVYPAAGLIHYATNARRKFIIDPSETSLVNDQAWRHVQAKATMGVPEVCDQIRKFSD